ncbi:MAG TPA: hypothetical protein VG838_04110 [Opitutaceae bacterium]|nr:hypothetical protein [Opitutaceae bacterium]
MSLRVHFALCLLAATAAGVRADPADEIKAAYERLRAQRSYSWETMEGKPGGINTPGVFKTPYGLARGSVTVERIVPHVLGTKRSDGSTVIVADTPRDHGATAVLPAAGAGVVSTPDGWVTREELQPRLKAAVKAGGAGRDALQIAGAALATKRPDAELPALIKDVGEFKVDGDEISGPLSPYMAGVMFGPAPDHLLVKDVTGTLSFQLKDGMIRAYTVRTEAVVTIRNVLPPVGRQLPGEGRIDESAPIAEGHETTTIIDYAPPAVPRIPEGAAHKLAELKAAAGPGR